MKKVLFAVAGLAIAASVLAQLSKSKDWDKSSEAYFLTPAERSDWKKVATEEEAERFIALYWAKRDPSPGTPANEFRDEISRRIAAADQQFKMVRYKRGADSVRGRLLVVLGAPSRVSQSRAQDAVSGESGAAGTDTPLGDDMAVIYTWTYDKDRLAPFGLPELRAQVSVDSQRGRDSLQNQGQVDQAIATVAEKSIVNPSAVAGATAPAAPAPPAGAPPPAVAVPAPSAPTPAAPGPAARTAPAATASAAPAPVAPTMPLPAGVKSALEAAAGKASGEAGFWSGTFRTPTGESFLAFQFYLSSDKPAFASAAPLKFGALITSETGEAVDSLWEDATTSEIAHGSRKDRVFDRSISLAPGSYKAVFGLFTTEGQPPVATSTVSFRLEPKTTDFEVSPLILSSALVPLTKRPGPTDPFVFGLERPIKVEPKGDHVFSKQDSLWYFYAVGNPALPAAAADAPAALPATTPSAGAAAAAPAPAAPKPRIMTRINVQRDGQDAFAPFTGPAEMQPISPGYYGTGSEIPLASFEPGYYTFLITVRDLNAPRGSAASKGVERKEDFVVLLPDGGLPPKSKAAGTVPTPKPKKP